MMKTIFFGLMKKFGLHLWQPARYVRVTSVAMFAVAMMFGCQKSHEDHLPSPNLEQVNLVANSEKYHPVTVDPTLINAFGLAWSPNGTAWVNSVGGHASALYSAEGAIVRDAVKIPSPTDTVGGFPCGIVFSGGLGFNLDNGPSLFLFSSFDGVISGWNPASGNRAKRLIAPANASYTGLAIASTTAGKFIYGANFGQKKIDVWDTAFRQVDMAFKDPTLPADYSPYNIQAIDNMLYVAYAQLGSDGHGVAGAGNGFVSVFNTQGVFIKRFASQGTLNVPWGMTAADASFLKKSDVKYAEEPSEMYGTTYNDDYGHDDGEPISGHLVLVGNFGDGRINVFSTDGTFLGQLRSRNKPVEIEGLWALSFGPKGVAGIDPGKLYFTAGPAGETDGLFGYIRRR